jgi:hypothetical protein
MNINQTASAGKGLLNFIGSGFKKAVPLKSTTISAVKTAPVRDANELSFLVPGQGFQKSERIMQKRAELFEQIKLAAFKDELRKIASY